MEMSTNKQKSIFLGSDHAGFLLKEEVKTYLKKQGYRLADLGTESQESVNWVEFGARVAEKVSGDPDNARGILICGSGIGMSIVANKFRGVRAALCNDKHAAEMSRKHNNANILTMGARVIDQDLAFRIVDTWLTTEFEGGRHALRLEYLHREVEKKNFG